MPPNPRDCLRIINHFIEVSDDPAHGTEEWVFGKDVVTHPPRTHHLPYYWPGHGGLQCTFNINSYRRTPGRMVLNDLITAMIRIQAKCLAKGLGYAGRASIFRGGDIWLELVPPLMMDLAGNSSDDRMAANTTVSSLQDIDVASLA